MLLFWVHCGFCICSWKLTKCWRWVFIHVTSVVGLARCRAWLITNHHGLQATIQWTPLPQTMTNIAPKNPPIITTVPNNYWSPLFQTTSNHHCSWKPSIITTVPNKHNQWCFQQLKITNIFNNQSLITSVPNSQSLITTVPNNQSLMFLITNHWSLEFLIDKH